MCPNALIATFHWPTILSTDFVIRLAFDTLARTRAVKRSCMVALVALSRSRDRGAGSTGSVHRISGHSFEH